MSTLARRVTPPQADGDLVQDELDLGIYDPWADPQPQPHPVELYAGTGIAGLYNGTITELEGWTVLPHPNDRRP